MIKNLLVFIMLVYKRLDQFGRKYITETDLTPNVIGQRNKYFLNQFIMLSKIYHWNIKSASSA